MSDLDGSEYTLDDIASGAIIRKLLDGSVYELGPPVAPGEAPVTTLISPTPGNGVDKTSTIVVDVTDADSELRRVMIVAVVEGVAFLAFDGVKYRPGYAAFSSRSAIANGFRHSVRRDAGWIGPVSVEVYPFDVTGNE